MTWLSNVGMNILEYITQTVLGQHIDNYKVDTENINQESGLDNQDLTCEQQIIQCQITNGRLLG